MRYILYHWNVPFDRDTHFTCFDSVYYIMILLFIIPTYDIIIMIDKL